MARWARSGQPLCVGIIGLGAREDLWACLAHLPALRAIPGFEVTALSTSSPESAASAGEKHGVARTFGNATDLAACDEVDLVVVSVRVPAHRELVSAAVQAGRAVFCEWPPGNGLAETEELARLVGEHDVPSIVGLQIRTNPVMNYLRDLVADGYVGEVLSNGTEGDIVVTAPIGHIQLAPLTLLGARGDAAELAVLPVPQSYRKVASLDWPATGGGLGVADFYRQGAFGVAHLYQQFLEDLREGGNSVPDFSDAVVRHLSIHNASNMP